MDAFLGWIYKIFFVQELATNLSQSVMSPDPALTHLKLMVYSMPVRRNLLAKSEDKRLLITLLEITAPTHNPGTPSSMSCPHQADLYQTQRIPA